MKTIVRRIAIYSFTLFLLTYIVPGFTIDGGITTLIIGGAGLAFMFLVLKPILSLISFPINLLTLGFSSILTNALILYLLTIFLPNISVNPFTYDSIRYAGFTTPDISFSIFFAYVYVAFVISLLEGAFTWLVE